MEPTTIVLIAIISAVVLFFFVATFKIFSKKKKDGGKKSKGKSAALSEQDMPEMPKENKAPKINKKKLQEMASKDAKIEPAFSKEELDKERAEELQKELEKNKANAKPQNPFMFPNMPFPMPTRTNNPGNPIPMPTRMPSMPSPRPQPQIRQETITVPATKEAKENAEFIKALQEKGVIKKELSFGESLMIKEAIDTPASKAEMKKKRQKWM